MKLHGLTQGQMLKWLRDGYLIIDDFLTTNEVSHYNKKLDSAIDTWKQQGKPNHELARLNHVDQVSGIIEYDNAFLELMEHPLMIKIMRDILGDDIVMVDNDGLIKYPEQKSHTDWHRDTPYNLEVNNEKKSPLMIKVFYFLNDVSYEGGCLAFIPGSTHLRNDQLPKTDKDLEDMPGHVRMNVKAGSAVIFNGSTYHSALNNYSQNDRRSIIYNFAPSFVRTWPGYEPSEKLKEKAVTPLRKMLFGMKPWVSKTDAYEDEEKPLK